MIRSIATAAVAIALSVVAGSSVLAQNSIGPTPDVAWIQWEADGRPHVRVLAQENSCPSVTADTRSYPMAERAAPTAAFADRVCDTVMPDDTARLRVGTVPLPVIPRAPRKIAMFGDTGCRLKGSDIQNCDTPAQWPFPTIVRDIAAERPDLVIHVGDYYYRESPCLGGHNCTDSPYGDNSQSWSADFFVPMRPLFAQAPVILARGNHETCNRAGAGWPRYLSGAPDTFCIQHEPPAFAQFDNLLVANVDDANEVTELALDPTVWLADLAVVQDRALAAHRDTWLVSHRPAVTYLATHPRNPAGSAISAYMSGHIHLFGAYQFETAGPQLIVGMGGDTLAPPAEVVLLRLLHGTTDRRFGYAIFNADGSSWNIEVHDVDTKLHRRCRMTGAKLTCGNPLTRG